MKKVLIGALVVSVLTGCGNNSKDEVNTNVIFKDELAIVSSIGEARGKTLASELLLEDVKAVLDDIFELAIFESSDVKYGEVTQGAGSDGNGGRIFCCKLPVEVTFTGSEASVERFVKYFDELDMVVSFGEFDITALEEDKYKVSTLISFLGKDSGGSLASDKKQYTIQKNAVDAEKHEEVSLREFDIAMIIRPNNSDSASISLGAVTDQDYRVYSDSNSKQDIKLTFSNEGSKYYCEYVIGNGDSKKALLNPKGNILVDILSCDVVRSDDEIAADLYVVNNSNKKVSFAVYDDEDSRVKFVEKVGSIEVKK